MDKNSRRLFDLSPVLLIVISLPGLLLFIGIIGYATQIGLREVVPNLPRWASWTASGAVPLLFLLGVGLFGAWYDAMTRPPARQRIAGLLRWAGAGLAVLLLILRMYGMW